MRRLVLGAALFVAAIVAVAAVAYSRGGGHADRLVARTAPSARAAAPDPPAIGKRVLVSRLRREARRRRARAVSAAKLTPAQLAGQRVVYAYAGLTPPASLLQTIRAGQAAGVIFFANNISSPSQLRGVIKQLQAAAAASPIHEPLLLMTDQEGGEVRRLPGPPALSEKEIGEMAHPGEVAHGAGGAAGRNLAGVGLNVNLAPVLDVYREAGNFIDELQRSYSSSPDVAATAGSAFIGGQQRTGVAATAKHFPGLGAAATDQNTDLGPVTLDLSLSQLRSVDEPPYKSAIAASVKLVMTSWATYPALDPNRPAGLSSKVILGELRGRLKFHGVTITDAISAGALSGFGSLGNRGVLAAKAGADLILCSAINTADNSPALGLSVLHAITAAIKGGGIGEAAARRGAAAVLTLRAHP